MKPKTLTREKEDETSEAEIGELKDLSVGNQIAHFDELEQVGRWDVVEIFGVEEPKKHIQHTTKVGRIEQNIARRHAS